MDIKQPIKVGTLQLENRMVMPPMATWKSNNGSIGDDLVQYYADRAGKIGLITMEYAYISEEGKTRDTQISIAKDEDIEGLKKIADAVHAKGTTKIFTQINHAGAAASYEVGNQEDINRIIACFVQAVRRTKQAGFDGVEIHCAHGYLLNQFYSPLTNHRSDNYDASSIKNRTRFAKEVLISVRREVGEDYPVSIRFGAWDFQEGGSTIDEAPVAAKIFEEAGADMISVTGGINGYMIKGVTTPGWFQDLSKVIKDAVNIPVLVTGGITTKEVANQILSSNKADLIGVGRPLLNNPDYTIQEMLGK